jgi:hypothetical protein
MKPGIYNIELDQGSVWRRRLLLSGGEDETPIDLAGFEVRAQIREAWNSRLVYQVQVVMVDAEAGEIELTIDDTERRLRPFELRWDLILTAPDGSPKKYIEGTVTVHPTITRQGNV